MNLLENWYNEQIKTRALESDNAQLYILQQLDVFISKFNCHPLNKWFNKPKHLGYYIYGTVGCGKSMIMDQLYSTIPEVQKTRLHFHEFMHDIQQQLANLKSHGEPLKIIAKKIRNNFKIIFLDEMIVNDIANAMILKNLFTSLFAENIYIITTSNTQPNDLYKDCLMRERFLPAIDLINQKLIVLNLKSKTDYRYRYDSKNELFIINNPNYKQYLEDVFNKISKNQPIENNFAIMINSRHIQFIKKSHDIIWFDFKVICGENRSQLDYLELVKQFGWFVIENISTIHDDDTARRFTNFIDVLYDHQCKLALSSDVIITEIYPCGDIFSEFERTKSRLIEMQTKEYISTTAKFLNQKVLSDG